MQKIGQSICVDNFCYGDWTDTCKCDEISSMKLPIANYITLSRIIGSLCLLSLGVSTQLATNFWFLYAFCGITDIADGYVARKLKAETILGALLDSIADIIFVICCSCKLITFMKVPLWLWYIAWIIVGIKFVNQISAWVVHERFLFLHSMANRLTGLMLFISIPLHVGFEIIAPLALTSVVAMYAAIQEGHHIRTR